MVRDYANNQGHGDQIGKKKELLLGLCILYLTKRTFSIPKYDSMIEL